MTGWLAMAGWLGWLTAAADWPAGQQQPHTRLQSQPGWQADWVPLGQGKGSFKQGEGLFRHGEGPFRQGRGSFSQGEPVEGSF